MMRRVNEASTAARAKEGELLKKCGKLGLNSSFLRGKMFIYGRNYRTRKGDARSSAAARSRSSYTPENGESVWGAEAQNGNVVEYPLSDAIKAQHQDDRLKGVCCSESSSLFFLLHLC